MTVKERTVKHDYQRNYSARKMAQRLGWLSIGLGVVQLLLPGPLSRTLGTPTARGLVRWCGLREVVTGVGLLKTEHPKPWVQARIGGDALDLACLGGAILVGEKPVSAMLAAGAVAGITSLDRSCEQGLSQEDHPVRIYDYSDRSGFPKSPDKMRGKASEASKITDMQTQVTGMGAAKREAP